MRYIGEEVLNQLGGLDELDTMLHGLRDEVLRILFSDLYAIQTTDGCGGGCDFCCLDSKFGIEESFSFSYLESLAKRFWDVCQKPPVIDGWHVIEQATSASGF